MLKRQPSQTQQFSCSSAGFPMLNSFHAQGQFSLNQQFFALVKIFPYPIVALLQSEVFMFCRCFPINQSFYVLSFAIVLNKEQFSCSRGTSSIPNSFHNLGVAFPYSNLLLVMHGFKISYLSTNFGITALLGATVT